MNSKKMENTYFSKIWITCIVLLSILCMYGLLTQTKSTYSASMISGKWQFNDCINYDIFPTENLDNKVINVNFTSYGASFNKMQFIKSFAYGNIYAIYYNGTIQFYYNDDGIVGDAIWIQNNPPSVANDKTCYYFYSDINGRYYKPSKLSTSTVDFGVTPQSVDTTFYNWFTTNAMKVNSCYLENGNYVWTNASNGILQSGVNDFDSCNSKNVRLNQVTLTFKDPDNRATIVPCSEYGEYSGCRNYDDHYSVKSKVYNQFYEDSVFKYYHIQASKRGYVFKGWKVDPEGNTADYTPTQDITLRNDLTLYPHFERILITVKYESNGGSGYMSSDVMYDGSAYNIKENEFIAPPGKEFLYWVDQYGDVRHSNEGIMFDESKNHYNLILTAQWKDVVFYTITYDANGGTNAPGSQQKVGGKSIELSNIIPNALDGYVFDYWTDGNTKYPSGASYSEDKDLHLRAIYKKIPNSSYSIIYSANGGTNAPSPTIHKGSGNISLEYPVRFGYTFTGWSKDAGCSGDKYSRGTEISKIAKSKNIILYACWQASNNNNRCELRSNPDTSDKYIIALVVLIISTMAWIYTYVIIKKAKQ